jgi:hypothetical protein
MPQSKGNGKGVAEFATGTLVSRHNLKAVVVDAGASLTAEDDNTREAVERVLSLVQPLAYFLPSNTSGQLHCIVDGSQFDAAAVEDQLQAIGTDSVNGYDFSGATVTLGTSIVVS